SRRERGWSVTGTTWATGSPSARSVPGDRASTCGGFPNGANRLRDALPPRGERAGPASPTASGCRRSLDSGQPIQPGRSPPGLGAVTDRIVAAEPCRADELRVEFERRRIDRRDGAQTPGALLPRAERVGEAGTRLAPTSFGSRGGQALEHCACTGRGREIEVAVANLNLLDDVG